MPELPEVQTTVNGIKKYLVGLTITDVWTDYNSSFHAGKENIKNPKYFKKFRREIVGEKIIGAGRIGKNVLINLSRDKTIVVHMKMTGHLIFGKYIYNKKKNTWTATDKGALRDDPFNRFVRLVFSLSPRQARGKLIQKSLALSDMRKFARVTLEETKNIATSKHLEDHGPDALDSKLTFDKFWQLLSTKPTWPIKEILMNHEIISGIGNIYSDEMLWRAGIHPLEKIGKISPQKARTLFGAMKKVLHLGMDFGGDSMSDYRNILGERGKFQLHHEAYHRIGEKCRKRGCGGTIRRIKIGGRSAHFCDKHQKLL